MTKIKTNVGKIISEDEKAVIAKYRDIFYQPRPVSRFTKADPKKRALQFLPFDALSGFKDEIKDFQRTRQDEPGTDELNAALLDETLQELRSDLKLKPKIRITYFIRVNENSEVIFRTVTGTLIKIDEISRTLTLKQNRDRKEIGMAGITEISYLREQHDEDSDV